MKKIVFVNATAATEGGILTVLKQFISEVESRNEEKVKYYVFTSIEIENEFSNIKIISDVKGKKKKDRIIWDMIGMKNWAKDNNIWPNIIISLQNTGVFLNKIPQIVYIHQPLPYAKESKWNIFKADERKMWFYKHIFKWWIDLTVKNRAEVIVQTEWMKTSLIDRGYLKDKITISKPTIQKIDIDKVIPVNKEYKYLFYPAADYKYKNHKVLIEAIKKIDSEKMIHEKFKVIFTLDKKSIIYEEVVKEGIEKYFEFIGTIKYNEVLQYYKGCQAILFPSYIETFGLPLIEGKIFGKKILVSNCNYSREVLAEYELGEFIKYNNNDEWVESIINSLNSYKVCYKDLKLYNEWDKMFKVIEKY